MLRGIPTCRALSPSLISRCNVILIAILCAWAPTDPGYCTVISLNSTATYLHVCQDPASNTIPILLADLNIHPGDEILLENLGGFDNGPGTDIPRITIAVFSASSILLPQSMLHRVPDAIDAGVDFVTANTAFCGGHPTDISEDFRVENTVIIVPAGATHLFACGHDQFYSDNSDPNGDYALGITKTATGLPHSVESAANGFTVFPGRPNPFRDVTAIEYSIPKPVTISLRIVDGAGRHVRTLLESISKSEGTFTAIWDGRNQLGDPAPSGVYFFVLESQDTKVVGRIVRMR